MAIYTGASRPKVFNTYSLSYFGTTNTYKFNTYTVREQNEVALLKSDNPFAIAVLANLYLIKGGKDPETKLAHKKNLIEIARKKGFNRAKLLRLLNFVRYLIVLPRPQADEFKQFYDNNTKIIQKMVYELEFIEAEAGDVVAEIRQKAREEAREEFEKEREKEREDSVMNIRNKMGLSAQQIADTLEYDITFVQSVISKLEKKDKEK